VGSGWVVRTLIFENQSTGNPSPYHLPLDIHVSPPAPYLAIVRHAGAVRVLVIWVEVYRRSSFGVHLVAGNSINPYDLQARDGSGQAQCISFISLLRQADGKDGTEAKSAVRNPVKIIDVLDEVLTFIVTTVRNRRESEIYKKVHKKRPRNRRVVKPTVYRRLRIADTSTGEFVLSEGGRSLAMKSHLCTLAAGRKCVATAVLY
jgi:hypothetical protein